MLSSLQRCIDHSKGAYRHKLVAQISFKGYELSKDPYGNYVIQYILKLKIPFATATLVSQFRGKYVELSRNKFSSNVVETCLKLFGEEVQSIVVNEILSYYPIEELLQDQFANYVIQSALRVSKGSLRFSLVEAIRPHSALLKTNPYSKKIFTRTSLKK